MPRRIGNWQTRHLFDVRIDALRTEDIVAAADDAIAKRQRLLIGVLNAAKLVNMATDEQLRRAVLGADVTIADGMSVVWACKLLRQRLPERVTGIDVMGRLLQRAHERQYRVYCLGAHEDVLSCVVARIQSDYPGVKLVGARNGYFSEQEEAEIARDIAAARPDMLFVGISSPKKERFLAEWAQVINVPVCHGVGGAFDVIAGRVKRAPDALQRAGLEWLYRVGQEPGRLWKRYLVTNARFAAMVARECGSAVRRQLVGTRTPARSRLALN
jgi:N-acetylglucosaminyldiphosphoundecaprenol N-acetyl-beta-D-mannosaminyltransferase